MSVAREVTPKRAIETLIWAAEVAGDPALLEQKPERPAPAEWRSVPVAEFREQMDRLLTSKHPEPGLDAIESVGCLDVWLPEVAAMVGFGDNEWRHKDVWKHTKQVVKQSVPRVEVRWGALLHDIGKPKTRRIDDRGNVTFHGHAEVGASMFRKRVADRIGFEGSQRERVHFLILHHLRAAQYDETWTDAAVRRFYKQMGEGLRDLLDLSRADITTKRPKIAPDGEVLVRGAVIMKELGIPPSKRLGDLMKQLTAAADSGIIEAGQAAEYYVEHLLAHRDEYGLD